MQKALAFGKRKMHYCHMRTHTEILAAPEAIAKAQEITGCSVHTVRSWRQRNSVPSQYWGAFVDARLATVDELMAAADFRTTSQAAA